MKKTFLACTIMLICACSSNFALLQEQVSPAVSNEVQRLITSEQPTNSSCCPSLDRCQNSHTCQSLCTIADYGVNTAAIVTGATGIVTTAGAYYFNTIQPLSFTMFGFYSIVSLGLGLKGLTSNLYKTFGPCKKRLSADEETTGTLVSLEEQKVVVINESEVFYDYE